MKRVSLDDSYGFGGETNHLFDNYLTTFPFICTMPILDTCMRFGNVIFLTQFLSTAVRMISVLAHGRLRSIVSLKRYDILDSRRMISVLAHERLRSIVSLKRYDI